MNKKIAVMGCGWLGLPLAESLVQDGYTVHGSTTSEEKTSLLQSKDIAPFLISLSETKVNGDIKGFLENTGVLIINIPPKLRRGGSENYLKKIQLLHNEIRQSSVEHVIFVSSTSVYGDLNGDVTEENEPKPTTESGKQLLQAENIVRDNKHYQTTIVRFGGLIGPNRHPIKMLSGRQNLTNGNAPVNLIHLEDCIGIINHILKFDWWNELINGVHPDHPSKKDYYTAKAAEFNVQPPNYEVDTTSKGKKIIPNVLLNVKNYIFTTTL